jgi:hypothetical protein
MNIAKLNTFKFTPTSNFRIPGIRSIITITADNEYPLLMKKDITSTKNIKMIILKISIYVRTQL